MKGFLLLGLAWSCFSTIKTVSGLMDAQELESHYRRNLAIPNNWIAMKTVHALSECDDLRDEIERLREDYGFDIFAKDDGSVDASVAIPIVHECAVEFFGDKGFARLVEREIKRVEVEPNFVIYANADPKSWGLNRIDQANLPLSKGQDFSAAYTGKGVNVYVIDTGINNIHDDFGGRAHLGGDFVGESNKEDGNGHGSHCSGTATGGSFGVAREATVYGVKVLSSTGSGSTSNVIKGVQWAVNNQKTKYGNKAAVLSMSLGGGKSTSMNRAVEDAASAGHIVVVAAGNENQDACNVSPASAGGNGRNGGVISVGSTDSSDTRSSFSNFGKCTDIFAPGSSITSVWKGSKTATNTISGTSMATPHVAGVAAILLEKHNHNKENAQNELFALAVPRVKSAGSGSPTILLQVPVVSLPPTPPTPKPTMPPTFAPAELCVGNKCFDFEPSKFGPAVPDTYRFEGTLTDAGFDLCAWPKGDTTRFDGQIVLVERGNCYFFDKVKNAQARGAAVVVIYQNTNDAAFEPGYNGNDNVDTPSCMVNRKDGLDMKNRVGQLSTYGPPDVDKTITQGPTPFVTKKPTPAPVPKPSKGRRRRRKRGLLASEIELEDDEYVLTVNGDRVPQMVYDHQF